LPEALDKGASANKAFLARGTTTVAVSADDRYDNFFLVALEERGMVVVVTEDGTSGACVTRVRVDAMVVGDAGEVDGTTFRSGQATGADTGEGAGRVVVDVSAVGMEGVVDGSAEEAVDVAPSIAPTRGKVWWRCQCR
jgi:hypothetical protein